MIHSLFLFQTEERAAEIARRQVEERRRRAAQERKIKERSQKEHMKK